MWCIFSIEKENLVSGSHIPVSYVHLPARSVPKPGMKDKHIDKQIDKQIYKHSPHIRSRLNWEHVLIGSRHAHTDPAVAILSIHFRRPHLDVASGIHISILMYILYNSCRFVNNQCMYELFTSSSMLNGTVIPHGCIPDFL